MRKAPQSETSSLLERRCESWICFVWDGTKVGPFSMRVSEGWVGVSRGPCVFRRGGLTNQPTSAHCNAVPYVSSWGVKCLHCTLQNPRIDLWEGWLQHVPLGTDWECAYFSTLSNWFNSMLFSRHSDGSMHSNLLCSGTVPLALCIRQVNYTYV